MLAPGTALGTFAILGPLGAGGMGEVYRARDTKLGREVAIKVLPADLAGDPDRLARFGTEARAASALNHPNLITIHEIGREGSIVYLVMELVEGETLRDHLSSGPLPLRKALLLAEQVATGLARAHAAGIVHRDLKPDNLMVRTDGLLKILDFGLAKQTSFPAAGSSTAPTRADRSREALAPTAAGVVLGTPSYMSPEQARGGMVDFRSDQFSLGSVLYEMVTGERAFEADSFAQTLNAIIEKEPLPAAQRNPRVPAPLQWLLDRCLAKDPGERYDSTLDLARDLRALSQHLSEVGSSAAEVASPRAGGGRQALRPILWSAAGALAGGAFCLALVGRLASGPGEPPTLRTLTFSGHDSQPDASPDGRTLAFTSDRDGVQRIWLRQITGGGEIPLTDGPDTSPRFSPDGSSLLFVRDDPEQGTALYRVATLGGEPRKILDDVAEADWSPDGQRIVFVRWREAGGRAGTALGVVGADAQGERTIRAYDNLALVSPRYSPAGDWIATSGIARGLAESRGKFILLTKDDGSESQEIHPAEVGGDPSSVSWLRSGEDIVYSQGESVSSVAQSVSLVNSGTTRILRQNIRTGASRTLLWVPTLIRTLDLANSGHLVFDAVAGRQNLEEFRLTAAAPRAGRRLTGGGSLDRQPVYSPDGEWVAFSSNRSGNLDVWAVSTRTGALRRLTDHPADDWDPAFTADGKQIIWTSRRSGNFEIWMAAADGSGARQVTRDRFDAENATIAPDQQWLIYNSGDPQGQGVWKVRPDGSGAQLLVPGALAWPEISPDGRYVAYMVIVQRDLAAIRFVRVADGAPLRMEIRVKGTSGTIGRCRWMPDAKAVVFIGVDARRTPGIFVQDFLPDRDTTNSRRLLLGFDRDTLPETFGISPDGGRITVAVGENFWSLMSADGIPDLDLAGARP
jgi:serine/threonine protein kinase